MRKVVLGLLIAVVLLTVLANHPNFGTMLYSFSVKTQANHFGLQKETVEVEGLPMTFYRSSRFSEHPNKPVWVLLHGFTADKEVWVRFAGQITDDYPVLIPDLAGHGETPYNAALDYTLEDQADWVIGLMDALSIEKAVFVGNSMGGAIAATLATLHPDRTEAAILFNPGGLATPEPSEFVRNFQKGHNAFLAKSEEDFAEIYDMTMAKPPYVPQVIKNVIAQRYIARRDRFEKIHQDLLQPNLLEDTLPEVTSPVLIVWGDQDRLIHVSGAKRWKSLTRGSAVQIMEGIGHMPMLEDPAGSAQIARDFVTGLPASQGIAQPAVQK